VIQGSDSEHFERYVSYLAPLKSLEGLGIGTGKCMEGKPEKTIEIYICLHQKSVEFRKGVIIQMEGV